MKIIISDTPKEGGADIMQLGILLNYLEDYKTKAQLDHYHKVALDMWIEYLTKIANGLLAKPLSKPVHSFEYSFEKNFVERYNEESR